MKTANRCWIPTVALALVLAGCSGRVAKARAAHDFACPEDQLLVEELPGSAFRVRGCGREAVYSCTESGSSFGNDAALLALLTRTTTCVREAPSSDAAPPSGRVFATGAFPQAAAGFWFGRTATEAAAACHAARGDWSAPQSWCSVAPQPIGSPASVRLKLCGDAICRIDVWTQPAAGETWLDRFRALRSTLGARYGAPSFESADLPGECAAEVISCLEDGRSRFWTAWQWPSRHAVTLMMAKVNSSVAIRILYERPDEQAQPAL